MHAFEYSLVTRDDSLLGFSIHFHRFHASLESPAENYSVAARKHIKPACHHRVINLGLRQQYVKLPFDRHQLAISKQLARSKARAVHNDWLG